MLCEKRILRNELSNLRSSNYKTESRVKRKKSPILYQLD
jgi:hypothetical protein